MSHLDHPARRQPATRALGLAALACLMSLVGAGCDLVAGPTATTVATASPTARPAQVASAAASPSAGPAAASPSPLPAASPTPPATATATPSPTSTSTPAGIPSPSASPAVAAPEGWASVADPNGRWRIDVPLSWRREIRFSHGTFTSPPFDAVTVVRIIPLSEVGGQRDLREAARQYVEGQTPPIDKVRLDGIDAMGESAAGAPRVQARYAFERRGLTWGATAVLELRGSALYVIDVATVRDKASDYSDVLQHMIGSLRFAY